MAFLLDGRKVVLDTAGWSPWFIQDSVYGSVALSAWSGILEDYDWLAIEFPNFHGAGAYPVHTSGSELPFARIAYGCRAVNGEQWQGNELVPDTVYVTTYDSLGKLIEGTFSARLTGYQYGGRVRLTDGSFRGRLRQY